MHICCRGLLGGLILLVVASPLLAQATKSDSVVKVSAHAERPDAEGKQSLTIDIAIEPQYHLYANPVGNPNLELNRTFINVDARIRPMLARVEYPEGKMERDKDLGTYRVYEGKATIKAQVLRAPGDTSPLEVSIKVYACKAKACLPPGTVKLTVP